ncbi:hypothetical protein JW926_02775 [Candidatus Sumerlaeota bacterium]|nr:hypothetical protein [Candidatus Sumerlaeota bacterium]
MEFPSEIIDQIRELHSTAKITAKKIKTEAEEAAQTEKVWAEFEQFLVKGWALHILDLYEKEASRIKKMRMENHPSIQVIDKSYRLAMDESERILRRYPALLEEACRISGLVLDTNSPHPRYGLEGGFFRLEIDEKKRMARFSDHEGRLAEFPADIPAVIETIKKEHKRVFGRSFNGSKFLKRLRTQYKAIIKKKGQVEGTSVPIRHITRRLGKNLKGFRTDEFLVDLSRLIEKGPFEIEGRRLDLQQTKDTQQGMLLHGSAARGYIGFIVFKEA